MMRTQTSLPKRILPAVVLLLAMLAPQVCCADSGSERFASNMSDSLGAFIVIGELGLLLDREHGKQDAVQGLKALAATCAATEILKLTVREKRPHSSALTSFPSGHASAAFAMATVISRYHPKWAVPSYAVASTIGWSRVEVGAHRWTDVIGGAALGYFMAKQFAKGHRGLSVSTEGISLQWQY